MIICSLIKNRCEFVNSCFELSEVGTINLSLAFSVLNSNATDYLTSERGKELTYDVDDEAWLAGEWTMLKVGLDVLWDHVLTCTVEFNSIVMLGSERSVVLFNAIATSAPIQM